MRARRVQKKGDDSVIKLRPVVPADLPRSVREVAGVRRRGRRDARRLRLLRLDEAGATKAPRSATTIARRAGRSASSSRRSSARFYAEHAGDASTLDELDRPRPDLRAQAEVRADGLRPPLVAELWLYPDNSRVLELSTKCAPSEAFQVAAEARAFLTERGIDLSGEQATKTRKALDFYSMEVAARRRRAGSGLAVGLDRGREDEEAAHAGAEQGEDAERQRHRRVEEHRQQHADAEQRAAAGSSLGS